MNWRRALIAAAVVLPVIALFAYGLSRSTEKIPSPLPGRPAPPFALDVMRPPAPLGPDAPQPGDTVRLAEHRGEVVVLNFWASWCLACRDEHAVLSRVARDYAGRDVQFYGVLYNDSPENARRWIREMGGQSYPTLLDPGARTAIDYGLYGVPETFIIGPDGRVAYKRIGPVRGPVLRERIDRLLASSDSVETS